MIFDTKVSDVLAIKGSSHVWTLPHDALMLDAVRVMRENSCGSVVVLQNGKIAGLVSERECLLRLSEDPRAAARIKLGDMLKREVLIVSLNTTVRECFALMTAFRARHLPVYDNEQLLGLVSIGDIVRVLIDDQQFTIDQLIGYVTGSYGYQGEKSWLSWIPDEVRVTGKAANE